MKRATFPFDPRLIALLGRAARRSAPGERERKDRRKGSKRPFRALSGRKRAARKRQRQARRAAARLRRVRGR